MPDEHCIFVTFDDTEASVRIHCETCRVGVEQKFAIADDNDPVAIYAEVLEKFKRIFGRSCYSEE